ncbi:hypothetical protein DYB32_008651 [Aphanomyces invadans]|uniref:Peptidase A2 domain-containing protein n=1 Tax=Aphanomyces invadans TaxID=157072 RepID=A0A418AKP6_9STRA|nr:hypothetical protein DYB32_008651 [Aphanomyces invadans]
MDRFTKRRVALWDFGRPYDEIWENDWIRWSNGAFQEEPRDLETMKRRLESAIRFDVKILDAESRVGKMLDGLMLALECDNQEWALYDEGKDVGDLMVKAVKPSMLQTAVKKQMQLQRNKSLRTDVFRFVRWLRTFAVGYQVYGGVEDEMKPSADHKVANCPKAAPGEAEALIQAQIQVWKEDRGKRAKANVIDLSRERKKIEGGAVLCDAVPVDQLLLDTGANVNVASAAGLINALKKTKADVQVVVDDTPTALYSYGKTSNPVMLSRRLLRGLPVRIDESDEDVALILSRRVMEALGFSTDVLLVQARTKKPEWDLSDSSFLPTMGDATVHRLQARRPVVEDGDPDDGMQCATPKLGIQDGETTEKRQQRQQVEVEAILATKVDEAKSQSLSPAGDVEKDIERHPGLVSTKIVFEDMPRGKCLTDEEKGQISAFRKLQKSCRWIAEAIHRSVCERFYRIASNLAARKPQEDVVSSPAASSDAFSGLLHARNCRQGKFLQQ